MKMTIELLMQDGKVRTGDDLAAALRDLADYFAGSTGDFDSRGESSVITDGQDSVIGKWSTSDDEIGCFHLLLT